jgi:hypothetical protein
MLQTDKMGSKHLERQEEDEGTVVKFVKLEELQKNKDAVIRQTGHNNLRTLYGDTLLLCEF